MLPGGSRSCRERTIKIAAHNKQNTHNSAQARSLSFAHCFKSPRMNSNLLRNCVTQEPVSFGGTCTCLRRCKTCKRWTLLNPETIWNKINNCVICIMIWLFLHIFAFQPWVWWGRTARTASMNPHEVTRGPIYPFTHLPGAAGHFSYWFLIIYIYIIYILYFRCAPSCLRPLAQGWVGSNAIWI